MSHTDNRFGSRFRCFRIHESITVLPIIGQNIHNMFCISSGI